MKMDLDISPWPWHVIQQDTDDYIQLRNEKGVISILDLQMPDARLIAAAPEMLEALVSAKKLMDSLTARQCPDTPYILVTDAIEKATDNS